MEVELSSSLTRAHYCHCLQFSFRLTYSSIYSRWSTTVNSIATIIAVATAGSRLSITKARYEAFATAACLLS